MRAFARNHPAAAAGPVCVGLSGGADSLALLAGATQEFANVHAIVVDHGLQTNSASVAATAAHQAHELGATAQIITAQVGSDGGPEAAARAARYAAFEQVRGERPVLLAHTRDDQAETVLLGLARGAGAHSLRAMAPWDPPYGRPLLQLGTATTRAACTQLGLDWWEDPHNRDPQFRRVRVRTEIMPVLEDVLGPGVADALARTAALMRQDDDLLATLAADALAAARLPADTPDTQASSSSCLQVSALEHLPPALLSRVLRAWLLEQGAAEVRFDQIAAIMALVQAWKGQGGVAIAAGSAKYRTWRHQETEGGQAKPAQAGQRYRLMVWREGAKLRMGMRR